MRNSPTVSIIIPIRTPEVPFLEALTALIDQDYPGKIEALLAVGTLDPSSHKTLAHQIPSEIEVRFVDNPTGSTPAGLNLALAEARGSIIVRCDAQSRLPNRYVSRVVELLATTGAENVGGMQNPVGSGRISRAIAFAMKSLLGSGGAKYRRGKEAGPTDTVYLGAWRKETLTRLGGFDEEMRRNQDYELNCRIREAKGTVWLEPDLIVEYAPRDRFRALASQYFDYGRFRRLTWRKHPKALRLRQVASPLLVIGLAAGFLLGIGGFDFGWWMPISYLAAILITGVSSSFTNRDPTLAVTVPIALSIMHLAWGTGFLIGPGRIQRSKPE